MFKSFARRRRKPENRVHIDLTEKAKERISSITDFVESWHMGDALKKLQDDVGIGEVKKFLRPYSDGSGLNINNTHHYLVKFAGKEIVFSYLEILLKIGFNAINNQGFSIKPYYNMNFLGEVYKNLNSVLVEEGILWELKIKKDQQDDYYFEFIEISSVLQKESDEELQAIFLGTAWENSLKGYNEAYNIFFSGANSFVIPEKLYHTFEQVVKKICEENNWNLGSRFKLSAGIEKIKEKGVFGDNKKFAMEVQSLVKILIEHTSKTAEERKRHIEIDRYYCNLLLHQSAAWLVYIIKKYEEFREK